MRVILVRHGETEHNKEDFITGQMDIGLNQVGIKQAEKTGERLKNEDFTDAYSSDLERTYETTKIIAEKHGLNPERYKEFRERGFGEYEGRNLKEYRELERSFEGEKHELKPAEGESLKEVGKRFVGKLDDLQKEHSEDDKILVGGHGVAIKASLMIILESDGKVYRKVSQDNTGLTELEYSEKHGWTIIRMNDTAHLEE